MSKIRILGVFRVVTLGGVARQWAENVGFQIDADSQSECVILNQSKDEHQFENLCNIMKVNKVQF